MIFQSLCFCWARRQRGEFKKTKKKEKGILVETGCRVCVFWRQSVADAQPFSSDE